MKFQEIKQGEIIVCEPNETIEHVGAKTLPGWCVNKVTYYHESDDMDFRKDALTRIYTAIDRGGGRWHSDSDKLRIEFMNRLADQLAELLVGGKPEMGEQYT